MSWAPNGAVRYRAQGETLVVLNKSQFASIRPVCKCAEREKPSHSSNREAIRRCHGWLFWELSVTGSIDSRVAIRRCHGWLLWEPSMTGSIDPRVAIRRCHGWLFVESSVNGSIDPRVAIRRCHGWLFWESSVTGSIDHREAVLIVTEPTRRKHASYVTRHGWLYEESSMAPSRRKPRSNVSPGLCSYLLGCPLRAQEHQVKGFASQSRRLRVNGYIKRLTFECNAIVNRYNRPFLANLSARLQSHERGYLPHTVERLHRIHGDAGSPRSEQMWANRVPWIVLRHFGKHPGSETDNSSRCRARPIIAITYLCKRSAECSNHRNRLALRAEGPC